MHVSSPAPKVHLHMKDGDMVYIGDMQVKIMHVPGHTPDSIALYLPEGTSSSSFPICSSASC